MDTFKEQAMEHLSRMTYFQWTMLILALLALVLGFFVSPYFLLILILPVFLTPIARETGLTEERDERIRFISYQSSHVTFYLTMLVIIGVFIGKSILERRAIDPLWFALLIIPIIYKYFASLALAYGARSVGIAIGYILGLFLFVYSLFRSPAIDPEVIFGILVLLVTVVSHWLPKLGGGLLALLGTAYFVVLVTQWTVTDLPMRPLSAAGLWFAVIVGAPLIMAGLLLFFLQRLKVEPAYEAPVHAGPTPSLPEAD